MPTKAATMGAVMATTIIAESSPPITPES
jgi:hypothetical protein